MAHVDNRMPVQVALEADGLGGFIRRGMQRTVESGHTSKIGLALWLDETGPEGDVKATLEVCRALNETRSPMVPLGDLWTLPLDGGTAPRAPAGRMRPRSPSSSRFVSPRAAAC